MVGLLVSWIEGSADYLFPGYARDTRIPEMDKCHIHRNTAYKILAKAGIYPHLLRRQRASCLKAFYNIPDRDATDWAGWEDP